MNHTLVYGDTFRGMEGMLSALPEQMCRFVEFDSLYSVESEVPAQGTLWFGRGMKRILRVSLIRRDGCWLVEISGADPAAVLRAAGVCRGHFDRWFGTRGQDMRDLEARVGDCAVERSS